jgi:hypothetical protein
MSNRNPFGSRPIALDAQVRQSLAHWPQRPPGLEVSSKQPGPWLRGRPDAGAVRQPFLKLPGTDLHRTLPDGLWLHFGPSAEDPYVDILCVEACGSMQNLLDKRSRFAPSTGSLLAHCPLDWLMAPAQSTDPLPRWHLIPFIRNEPNAALVLPVRDLRVLFALKQHHYVGFARSQMAAPHEFYCPMETLTDAKSASNPALRALLARAAAAANFMELPPEH